MTDPTKLPSQFQGVLDDTVQAHDDIHNAVMLVEMPGFVWKGASGLAQPDAGVAMHVDDQFFSASTAKMITATVALLLVEAGKLTLDDPIARYLPATLIAGLHEYEGRSYGEAITVRQCLSHTTGLADNWDEGFLALLTGDPDKLWKPEETIEYVKQHCPPRFAPGQGFSYSDINYNLIGLVIEQATGQSLQAIFRDLIFDPLEMHHTYRQYRENPRPSLPGRTPSAVFYDDMNYTSWRTLSADWAGGGLQTTVEDLRRFLRAFVDDTIFDTPASRAAMLQWVETNKGDSTIDVAYGLGVIRAVYKNPPLGEIWGHQGASSSFMYYWPRRDAIFCGTFNQNRHEGKFMELLPRIAALIAAVAPVTAE